MNAVPRLPASAATASSSPALAAMRPVGRRALPRLPGCRAGAGSAAATFGSQVCATVLGLLLAAHAGVAGAADGPAVPPAASAAQDFSAAERLLLMSPQLQQVRPPAALSYRFRKSGSLEEGFDDRVTIRLQRDADGGCCQAGGEFLTGARRLELPQVEHAQGNPVTLYFLEHDIREMKRLTKGSTYYFRKRIRMALYEAATVREASVTYRGRQVPAREIRIQPYRDDPNRARFERFTGKEYVFVLSDAVPGMVVSIRSRVPAETGSGALIEEELLVEGAEPLRLGALRP